LIHITFLRKPGHPTQRSKSSTRRAAATVPPVSCAPMRALDRAGRAAGSLAVIEAGALNVAAGQQAGFRIAVLPPVDRPTAVFCANDLIALGMLQAMTRSRIRVPEDLAIVGYDDIDFAAVAGVPLASVRQPRRQLGRSAYRLLLEEAAKDDGHQHRHVFFQPEPVVRQSTPAGDPEVQS
jgi:LacI family transcriptional regulator